MSMQRLRNNVAWKGANFLLKHVATPWYRDMIGALITAGVKHALVCEHKAAEHGLTASEWADLLKGERSV